MDFILHIKEALHYRLFYNKVSKKLYLLYQDNRINKIRKKERITVLFIIGEASTWKTEILYLHMLSHPRFNPVLGVTESFHVRGSKNKLIEYLRTKNYPFIDLDVQSNSIKQINPDLKFYYKPYELNYRHGLFFDYNRKSLVCSINYGFNASGGPLAYKHAIRSYAWKEFLENKAVQYEMKTAGKNIKNKSITGLPIQDTLSLPKNNFNDSWNNDNKKRIIYAPHHSMKGTNGNFIEYSTFLEFGEFMLEMAKKYDDEVQWIFKPHPALKNKLKEIWGEEKTEEYYNRWKKLPNAKIELGEYYGIFKHSDAMIHDCSSFIIEYMYADNPVLFLETKHHTAEEMVLSTFGYDAYVAHQHASTKDQIENFILQVLNGEDPNKKMRHEYMDKYLKIPNGKKASENIIDVILGIQ